VITPGQPQHCPVCDLPQAIFYFPAGDSGEIRVECPDCGVFTPKAIRAILASKLNKSDQTSLLRALKEWRDDEIEWGNVLVNGASNGYDLRIIQGKQIASLGKVRLEADKVLKTK